MVLPWTSVTYAVVIGTSAVVGFAVFEATGGGHRTWH
jgi:hypothetical protein